MHVVGGQGGKGVSVVVHTWGWGIDALTLMHDGAAPHRPGQQRNNGSLVGDLRPLARAALGKQTKPRTQPPLNHHHGRNSHASIRQIQESWPRAAPVAAGTGRTQTQ